jgi:hypothetical protein
MGYRAPRARPWPALLFLAVGMLSPAARAESPDAPAARAPVAGVRERLLADLDRLLQSQTAATASPEALRRTAARFLSDQLASESPLSPQDLAEVRRQVREKVQEAVAANAPKPRAGGEVAQERAGPVTTAAAGVLSGRVTRSSDGAGIGGSAVILYRSSGSSVVAYADGTGNYSFTGLSTGTYYVKTNNFDGYLDQAWNNVRCDWSCTPATSGATAVLVTDGATTSGIDFALEAGGRIAGTVVSSATGTPIGALLLFFHDAAGRAVTYTYTSGSGTFTSYGGLASGAHYLKTQVGSLPFLDELYDNLPCPFSSCLPTSGTPVAVVAPGTTGGVHLALDPGGGVAGRVTDASTSGGLAGVIVQVLTQDGRYVGNVASDASGNWSSPQNLPTGTYVAVTQNDLGYIDEMWNDIACPGGEIWACGGSLLGTPISVVAGTVSGSVDFALGTGGRIAGQVTDASTTSGIAYSAVDIYTDDGRYVASAYADGSGNYTTTGLPASRYRAQTTTWSSALAGHIPEIWDDVPCFGYLCDIGQASPITVSLGATTSGIDFALEKGARVAGRVTDASTAAGLPDVYVDIYSENGRYVAYGYADGAGSYTTLPGLPASRVYARTSNAGTSGYADEAWDDLPCLGCRAYQVGTPIPLTPGATTSGIDFALSRGGGFSGKVTRAADGSPLRNWVYAYTPGGSSVGGVYSDSSGNYTVGGLPTGRYVASTRAYTTDGLVGEVYSDRPCAGYTCDLSSGTPIAVTGGSTTPGIDFALSPGARLSGRVTDQASGNGLSGVTVQVLKPPSGVVGTITTDALGYFSTLTGSTYGFPTGGYYLATSNAQGYLDEVFDNVPCLGCDVTAGTKVQLTAGATTAGLDFALAKGGRIEGTVTRAGTGDPIPLLGLRVYDSGGRLVDSPTTSFAGTYRSRGLPAGTYYVGTRVIAAGLVDELYDNVPFCSGCNPLLGTPVTVAGSTVSGIDLALESGGGIEGRVTDAATSAALLGAYVYVFNAGGKLERSTLVDALGNYEVRGLAPGTHHALAIGGGGYLSELYDNVTCLACNPTTGAPITVTAGATTPGIDFALARGGGIQGTVTRASDGQPLGATVQIYDAAGAMAGSASPDSAGFYRFGDGLPSGTYYAKAVDTQETYAEQLFSSLPCKGCDPTAGTPITVTSPAVTTGVDFSLDVRALDFYSLSPCRVLDTRRTPGALGGPALAGREDRVVAVLATCGIPLTARSVSVNITVTGPTAAGDLRIHPGGTPLPPASAINYRAGQTRANNAVLPLSRFGELAVYTSQASGTVHVIIDVNGYFQ